MIAGGFVGFHNDHDMVCHLCFNIQLSASVWLMIHITGRRCKSLLEGNLLFPVETKCVRPYPYPAAHLYRIV